MVRLQDLRGKAADGDGGVGGLKEERVGERLRTPEGVEAPGPKPQLKT